MLKKLNTFQVLVKHVQQAFSLLNKSIIRVEQPDISLEEDDPEQSESPIRNEGIVFFKNFQFIYFLYIFTVFSFCALGRTEEMEEDVDDPAPQQELPKKKLTLTFDEYQKLTNSLVIYMRTLEEKRVAEGDFSLFHLFF